MVMFLSHSVYVCLPIPQKKILSPARPQMVHPLLLYSPDSALSPQLIGATAISYGVKLNDRFQVDVVGNITTG